MRNVADVQSLSCTIRQLHVLHVHVQISTTDPEVTSAAKFAAEQLSSESNSLSPFEVKEVLSARTKVVSGKAYELKLKLSQGNLPEQIYQV